MAIWCVRDLNLSAGLSYDILTDTLLNQFVQVSYNGGCCGLSVEYGRFNLATVRSENQFRVGIDPGKYRYIWKPPASREDFLKNYR